VVVEKWYAASDELTCAVCKGLDGLIFTEGSGPQPPIHPRCRCTRDPDPGIDPGQMKTWERLRLGMRLARDRATADRALSAKTGFFRRIEEGSDRRRRPPP